MPEISFGILNTGVAAAQMLLLFVVIILVAINLRLSTRMPLLLVGFGGMLLLRLGQFGMRFLPQVFDGPNVMVRIHLEMLLFGGGYILCWLAVALGLWLVFRDFQQQLEGASYEREDLDYPTRPR